jgi:hypothetical protein
MSLQWKETAKRYKKLFQDGLDYLVELSENESEIIVAARQYKAVCKKPSNPYVPLVGGRDINIEKAKEKLFKVLEKYEIVM